MMTLTSHEDVKLGASDIHPPSRVARVSTPQRLANNEPTLVKVSETQNDFNPIDKAETMGLTI